AFVFRPERVAEVMALSERDAITDMPLLVRSLVVLAAVLAGFVLHPILHVEPSIVAMIGALVLIVVSRLGSDSYLAEVEGETLLCFTGLFIMVGGARQGRRDRRDRGPPRRRHGREYGAGDRAAALRCGRAVRRRGQHPVRH